MRKLPATCAARTYNKVPRKMQQWASARGEIVANKASGALSLDLIGTWELLSREDRTAAGERHIDPALGADPLALLFYDRAGNFAAQFMKRDRDAAVGEFPGSSAPNNSRAQGGYDAYFGTYTTDDAEETVTQRLVGALSRENVGQVLTRKMAVSKGELVIRVHTASSTGVPVVRTLRWRRIG